MNELRQRVSLGGDWHIYIGDVRHATVPVPSSYHPVGVATLKRRLPGLAITPAGRLLLIFDGVANEADVAISGHSLGHIVAFSRHTFDVTDLSSLPEETDPELAVTIRDLNAEFGNSRGWETYGGIIRDVYLEQVPAIYAADLYAHASVSGERADLMVELEVCNAIDEPNEVTIQIAVRALDGDLVTETVHDHVLAAGRTTITHRLPIVQPQLWSPDRPYLYRLTVDVRSAYGADRAERRIGLRTVEVRGRRFYLNGRPLFLKGVCRHDTWFEQGYTLTREQMDHDMRAIKELGANFVRLVHYPHHPEILDLADELGLFVTEEPGFWNVHLGAENMGRPKEVALEIMRRTILRDRSHACLFAWLLGNECWPDSAYLNAGKRLCNALDPGRLVGFSDLYNQYGTYSEHGAGRARSPYPDWNPDFHDVHPYGEEQSLYRAAMRDFRDKPLIFGEWGGYWVHHDDWLLQQLGQVFAAAAHAPVDAPEQLAGIAYWEWADMRQYNRGRPACEDGVLREGLVTEDRRRRHQWDVMHAIFQEIDEGARYERGTGRFGHVVPTVAFPADVVPLDVTTVAQSTDQERAWQILAPTYAEWSSLPPNLPAGGCRLAQAVSGKPLLLSVLSPRVRVEVSRRISELWLMGLGTLTDGYPVIGQLGDKVLRLAVVGPDLRPGQEMWLCQGRHIARQNSLYQGSRINPVTLEAHVLFDWIVDPDAEIRQVRVFVWHLPQTQFCTHLDVELIDGHTALVLHALSVR